MPELPVPRSDIQMRLKKVEGQIRGIAGMVEKERDCIEVITQLAAAKAALESVVGLVLRNYTAICMEKGPTRDVGADLARAVSLWVGGKS